MKKWWASLLLLLASCKSGGSGGGGQTDSTSDSTLPTIPKPSDPNRLVIDPVTRIEGHLRIETQLSNGAVGEAWSAGMLFRGIESILNGRQPEDAWLFTQRLCGVCTYVHGSTSVRCVEDAMGITVPDNARNVRNLLMGAQFLHDHIIHFYHLHALDWVDIVSALDADPVLTAELADAVSPDAPDIDLQIALTRLQRLVGSGRLGPFTGGYWGHPAYILSAEENLLIAAHYLEALRQQARTANMHAIFGGKNPHVQSLRVGGVTCRDDITTERIAEFRTLLQETVNFIDTVYIPDVMLLAERYKEWASLGKTENFLAYGEFPLGVDEPASLFFPQGVIFHQGPVRDLDARQITEHVRHSWYAGSVARHPEVGETDPDYVGFDTTERYSWLKAPRYQDEPMEVGPLARMLVAYGSKMPEAVNVIDDFLAATGLTAADLCSTLGRTVARALETQIIGHAMEDWLDNLATDGSIYQSWSMPSQASGMGLNEAPRGALGHWINIDNQVIANYQMVVPSTWNFGPRCGQDRPGPVESALVGTPVLEPARPVEILRTVHSFDPCIACAVHVIDPNENRVYEVRVV
jgi:[NiFe] hydrogenase large subunit